MWRGIKFYIKLYSETMNQLNAYFNSLDKDHNGMINIEDVLSKFEEMKFHSSRITILRELFQKNKNTQISYSDFVTRALDITREVEQDDLMLAFQHFDTDGSGKITKEDLKNIMKRKGEYLNEEELDELINQVDESPINGDAKNNRTEINFETFKNYIYKLSPMSPSMRQGNLSPTTDRDENFSFELRKVQNQEGDGEDVDIEFYEDSQADIVQNNL